MRSGDEFRGSGLVRDIDVATCDWRRWSGCTHLAAALVASLGVGLALVSSGASAQAAPPPFVSAFGSSSFSHSTGVAVDQETGNVYVADGGNHNVVKVFSAEGGSPTGAPSQITGFKFEAEPAAVAVDNACYYQHLNGGACESFDGSNGDIYVADVLANEVDKIKLNMPTERYEVIHKFAFSEPNGVAVDPRGNVYVADFNEPSITEFNSGGEEVGKIAQKTVKNPAYIAVDSLGDVYVGNYEGGVAKIGINAKDEVQSEALLDPTGRALAVGGQANVLVDDLSAISEYDSSGNLLDTFGASGPGAIDESFGVAVNGTIGDIYVSDTVDGVIDIFGSVVRPGVTVELPSDLETTAATIETLINPNSQDTTIHFEYGTDASYGARTADVGVGSGTSPQHIASRLAGLQPGTTYHYRAVASNSVGTTEGPDQTFETFPVPVPGLPDHRAYELVTPSVKGDAEDMFGSQEEHTFDVGVASEDGNEFLLWTGASFGAFPASYNNVYRFARGGRGWTFVPLASPGLGIQSVGTTVYNPFDFSEVGVESHSGSEVNPSALQIANLVGPPGGPYATLDSGPLSSSGADEMVGSSSDLSHVVLENKNHALASGDSGQDAGTRVLYEWVGGQMRLVNVNTEGSLISLCGAALGLNGASSWSGGAHNAVSGDGSKVFFTAPEPGGNGSGCWEPNTNPQTNPPQLYMRLNGTRTVDISAPNPGVNDADGLQPAAYVGASSDGSKVFFMTQTELTADDITHDPELYEYDTNTATLTRVSRGSSGNADGNVYNVPAISSDGSTIYFTAFGQLAPGAAAQTPNVGGSVNLYRYDTNTKVTTYITTVGAEDYPSDSLAPRWYKFPLEEEIGLDLTADWYTTADGRYLVFASTRDITSYDSAEASSQAECKGGFEHTSRSGHCDEVYRYDSASSSITCVSCNPTGAAPTSNALFTRDANRDEGAFGAPPRGVSNDGGYVFFDTAESLVPQDNNGKIDVYEWHNGRIFLISSGQDPADSFYLDSSPDGSNVFFGTHAQLVSQDTDTSGDLYDARVGGGFVGAAGETGPCEGDACQSPPPAPNDATPGSLTFSGAGNLTSVLPAPAMVKPKTAAQIKAEKLAKALKACKRHKAKAKRSKCEKAAKKKYVVNTNAKGKKHAGGKKHG